MHNSYIEGFTLIRHVCFSQIRHSESKIISNNYPSHSSSLVKISTQTVEVLLSNGVQIVQNQHKNHSSFITFIHLCSVFSGYLKKEKKQYGILIDSESLKKGLQNHTLFDFFRVELC